MGCPKPQRLLEKLTAAELAEWMAYYEIEPWGEERADIRQAITSALIANQYRGKNQRPYKVQDFLAVPQPDRQSKLPAKEMSVAEMKRKLGFPKEMR